MVGIGFDFDHTLGIDNRLEKTVLVALLGRERLVDGVDEPAAEKRIDAALHAYRSGSVSIAEAIRGLLREALSDPTPADALTTRFFDECVALAPKHVEALPGATALLERLRDAGIPTAILTNGWNPLQQRKADLIGYAGTVLVSDDMGIRKPDPRAFDALAKALGVAARDVIYVGDSPHADISGALGAGMRAVWYDWENHRYDPAMPAPTTVVRSLDEIDALAVTRAA